ncbi:hypothetical protein HKD37_20G055548 [Glycine soja]
MIITRTEEEMFNTVLTKDQLDRHWHLVEKHDNMHDVVYNKDLVNPIIVHGWTTLRTFYGLEGDHHGQCLFLLTIFKTSSNVKNFPKWHALYHQVPSSITFKVLLNEYKVMCNNLKIVPNVTVFTMISERPKIGFGCRAFSKAQSFKPDMEIVFEFPDPNVNYALV